jgi:hypothetical protein
VVCDILLAGQAHDSDPDIIEMVAALSDIYSMKLMTHLPELANLDNTSDPLYFLSPAFY